MSQRRPSFSSIRDNSLLGGTYVSERADPTWADVEELLSRLDGERHDDGSLTFDDKSVAILGGGKDARVCLLVYLSEQGEQTGHQLTDSELGDDTVTQFVGGQETPLPAKMYVSKSLARSALHRLCHEGTLDESLGWVASG